MGARAIAANLGANLGASAIQSISGDRNRTTAPGAKAAWAKFDGYIPRKEPVDSIAGGRIPAVDRIEWSFISDPSTAMAALVAGEQDYWDAPTLDLVQVMRRDPNIVKLMSPVVLYHFPPPK